MRMYIQTHITRTKRQAGGCASVPSPVYAPLSTRQFLFFFLLYSQVYLDVLLLCTEIAQGRKKKKNRKGQIEIIKKKKNDSVDTQGNAGLKHGCCPFAYITFTSTRRCESKQSTEGEDIKMHISAERSGNRCEWSNTKRGQNLTDPCWEAEHSLTSAFSWSLFLIREMGTNARLAPLEHESTSHPVMKLN